MSLQLEEVRKVAQLARLSFSDAELARFQGQLNKILDYVRKLDELDTSRVEPTSHVVDLYNQFREDEANHHLLRDAALANAPAQREHMIKVPRVVSAD